MGSRTIRLLNLRNTNRGRPLPGIALTTNTVNERRADQRYFEARRVPKASRGFYDMAKARLTISRWHGPTLAVSYWFSKAVDLGGDLVNTAAGSDSW